LRLWSLHPALLDARGLVALWREGLLARKVLRGRTTGYRHHPQLERFRACALPVRAIDAYLWAVHAEATARGYAFDGGKLGSRRRHARLIVTAGQVAHERRHLVAKLRVRFPAGLPRLRGAAGRVPHPLFRVVPGPVAPWEKLGSRRRSGTARFPGK
jgi:hypothetical protein